MKTLLKYIFNSDTFSESGNLSESFRILYEKEFIDENEREDFDVIKKRIITKVSAFDPYSFIILSCNEANSIVYGGLIGDWYENSKTIHLTYIVVNKDYRGKNIGRDLVKIGLEKIKQIIRLEKGVVLKNVFFETNIPGKTKIDNFDIGDRLKIFSRLGAKWIDIPYVQPALDKKKETVKNLFLCVFPELIKNDNFLKEVSVKKSQTIDFLYDLYKGLGVEVPELDSDFKLMVDALKDESVNLKRIPIKESNSYVFNKCAVAFHFIQSPGSYDDNNNKQLHCCHFHSYETDLLNFRYQSIPPFHTHLELSTAENIMEISFPDIYHYTSEGRVETVYCTTPLIKSRYSLSYTWFNNSKTRIWHLVLSPLPEAGFTEHDLIKLATVFGSRQEESDLLINTRFLKNGQSFDTIADLVASHTDGLKNCLIKSGTGVVEIESTEITTGMKKPILLMNDIFKYLTLLRTGESSLMNIEKKIKSEDNPIDFLKIICGILLGIFDFERMGIEEIEDTLNPIEASDSYFTTLSRGNLMCIGKEEDLLKQGAESFGINPYLLIPSSVLVYNEYILMSSKLKLDITLNHEHFFRIKKAKPKLNNQLNGKQLTSEFSVYKNQNNLFEKIYMPGFIEDNIKENRSVSLKKLNDIKENVEHNLNKNLLENVFHYPSEKLIMENGYKQRQLNDVKSDVKLKLKELADVIDTKNGIRDGKIRGLNAALLAFISCLTFQPILKEFGLELSLQVIILAAITVAFTGLVFILALRQK